MGWLQRLRNTVARAATDADLDEELRFHIERRAEQYAASGLTPDEAKREALRRFGNPSLARDRTRDADTVGWLADLGVDTRQAVRALRASPAFTATAIATLALGTGANTAMFTLADALLFRPIAVHEPDRLVRLEAMDERGRAGGLLTPLFEEVRDAGLLDGVCGVIPPNVVVEMNGRIAPVPAHAFAGDCFGTLGVTPALGRVLTAADDEQGAARVAVIGYETWQREFGGRPSVLGERIDIDGAGYTIVGVAQEGFTGLRVGYPARLFFPLGTVGGGLASYFPPRDLRPVTVVARLPPGMAAEQAAARLRTHWPQRLARSVPARFAPAQRDRYVKGTLAVRAASAGIDASLRGRYGTPLVALLLTAAVVFLIACVNLTSLLLARSVARRREAAIRVALGASRWRLTRGAAVEAFLVLSLGTLAGIVVARVLAGLLVAMFQGASPTFGLDIALNGRVFAFTICASALAWLCCSAAASWRAGRVDAHRIGAASTRLTGDRARLRQATVVTQVAMTVVLIGVGALAVDALARLRHAPVGMPVERVTTAQLTALPGGYGEGFAPQPYYAALLERVDALPGVASAALSYNALLAPVAAARVGVAGSDVEVQAEQALVSDAFFTTLQIPLVAGTGFPAQPRSGAARGVIVSASLAADLFGNADAVGRAVRLGASPQTQAMPVLGVARDAVLSSPQERNTRVVYLSFWQAGHAFQMYPTLVVRTDGETGPGASDLQAAVRAGAREYVSETRTLAGQRDASLVQERLLALVSTAFAAVGLAIAAIGLYGLLGFTVAQRTSEIGVRMALGAGRRRIAAAVVGGAWRLIAAGVAFGAPAAWAASRAAAEAVYGQASTGLVPTAVAVALMFGIGTAAAWRPVRRALRVDPASALRAE